MALCLASWGCGPELGEKRDSHQRQRVPGERVREGSGLPGGGHGWKEEQAPVTCGGGRRECWVLSGVASRAHIPGARDSSADAPCPSGTDRPAGALARMVRKCRPLLFASELLRSLSVLGGKGDLEASSFGLRGGVCGVLGAVHGDLRAHGQAARRPQAHLCRLGLTFPGSVHCSTVRPP